MKININKANKLQKRCNLPTYLPSNVPNHFSAYVHSLTFEDVMTINTSVLLELEKSLERPTHVAKKKKYDLINAQMFVMSKTSEIIFDSNLFSCDVPNFA